jgi:hypothetical protein
MRTALGCTLYESQQPNKEETCLSKKAFGLQRALYQLPNSLNIHITKDYVKAEQPTCICISACD